MRTDGNIMNPLEVDSRMLKTGLKITITFA